MLKSSHGREVFVKCMCHLLVNRTFLLIRGNVSENNVAFAYPDYYSRC